MKRIKMSISVLLTIIMVVSVFAIVPVAAGAQVVPDGEHFTVNAAGTVYTIHDADGWELFCSALNDLDTYNRFSGKTVTLSADITVSTMAGSDKHDFCGTFDGDKHTLTFNYGNGAITRSRSATDITFPAERSRSIPERM